MIQSEFLCKCGKFKNWVSEGRETEPCPNCGRKYIGKYSKNELTIIPIEIKKNK